MRCASGSPRRRSANSPVSSSDRSPSSAGPSSSCRRSCFGVWSDIPPLPRALRHLEPCDAVRQRLPRAEKELGDRVRLAFALGGDLLYRLRGEVAFEHHAPLLGGELPQALPQA